MCGESVIIRRGGWRSVYVSFVNVGYEFHNVRPKLLVEKSVLVL